jgi:hypothetical protein
VICPDYKSAVIGALVSRQGEPGMTPNAYTIMTLMQRQEWIELMGCDLKECQCWHQCQGRE